MPEKHNAERRERYTKAVEQLGSKEAPVRIGGVYTLVKLVDEWIEDESIEKYEDRLKEGQVIIITSARISVPPSLSPSTTMS